MGKSSGASFLSKFKGLTRSGRAHKVPSRLREDDTSQGGGGVGGGDPRGGGGGGRAPRGGGGGGRGNRGKKLRAVSEIGGSSLMPSYTEAPSESEEEEYVPDGEEEEAEEEGEEEEAEEEGEEEAEEGGGEVDPALWGDLPPGSSQGWLRGNAGLPTPPSIEEHKWLIEPVGTE